MDIRTHAPDATSTCSVGGLIDYFVTHEHEHQILEDIKVIKDTVVTPHCPVAATIREDIYIYVKGPAKGRGTEMASGRASTRDAIVGAVTQHLKG